MKILARIEPSRSHNKVKYIVEVNEETLAHVLFDTGPYPQFAVKASDGSIVSRARKELLPGDEVSTTFLKQQATKATALLAKASDIMDTMKVAEKHIVNMRNILARPEVEDAAESS